MTGNWNVLAFWGKARQGNESPYHPALYHMLDVAACAKALLGSLTSQIGPPLHPLAVFLVALHDIGEFSRSFQSLAPPCWPAQALGAFPGTLTAERHDTLGFRILIEKLPDALAAYLDGASKRLTPCCGP